MQVNTRWLPVLAHELGMTGGQVKERLLWDGCFNIATAGAILRTYVIETYGDLMRAIGDSTHTHPR